MFSIFDSRLSLTTRNDHPHPVVSDNLLRMCIYAFFFQSMERDLLLLFSGVAREPLVLLGQKENISGDTTVR